MSRLSLNQKFAYIFGAVFVLIGLVGFATTGTADFAAQHTGKNLLLFQLNPLHNIVHLVIGLAMIISARTPVTARMTNVLIGAVYLLVGVVGLFVANATNSLNVLALNQSDNGLHLATAILALGIALAEKPVLRTNAG